MPFRSAFVAGLVAAVIATGGAVAPATITVAAPGAGCSGAYPIRLALTSDDPDERQYFDRTVVCATADLTDATLRNDTGLVWSFESSGGAGFVDVSSSPFPAAMFREGLRKLGENPPQFVAPGETMLLSSTEVGGITDLSWEIDPVLTSVWLVQDAIVARAQKLVKGGITALIARRLSVRTAIVTCAFAGVSAGNAVADLEANSDDFLDVFETAATLSPCITAWRQARVEAPTRFPTLKAAVVGASESVTQVVKLRSSMGLASKLLSVGLKLVPR
jgi:hypothetical protein